MYILFDVGATNMRVGRSVDHKTVDQYEIISTPSNFEQGSQQLLTLISSLAHDHNITAIAGGIAGTFNIHRTELVSASHLPLWVGHNLKTLLEQKFSVPVWLENDAALVGLGEAHHGAGQGSSILAYLTISTGIGGARFIDGYIDRSSFSFEPGKQIIEGGLTLEQYVSGSSFEKRYGKPPAEITDVSIWQEANKWLAYGLNNIIVQWSPDTIVLGGGMMQGKNCFSFEQIQSHLQQICTIYPTLPRLVKATLKDHGGLEGSLVYLKQQCS